MAAACGDGLGAPDSWVLFPAPPPGLTDRTDGPQHAPFPGLLSALMVVGTGLVRKGLTGQKKLKHPPTHTQFLKRDEQGSLMGMGERMRWAS